MSTFTRSRRFGVIALCCAAVALIAVVVLVPTHVDRPVSPALAAAPAPAGDGFAGVVQRASPSVVQIRSAAAPGPGSSTTARIMW